MVTLIRQLFASGSVIDVTCLIKQHTQCMYATVIICIKLTTFEKGKNKQNKPNNCVNNIYREWFKFRNFILVNLLYVSSK